MAALYTPPRPRSLPAIAALARAAFTGDPNLLGLLPKEAYTMPVGWLGYSRRSILIVNAPDAVRQVLNDDGGRFPKSDLMVGALAPLVGNSIFVASGPSWRRQRAMTDPAFTHMRLQRAFPMMAAAVGDYVRHLEGLAARGEAFSLDLAMSHLTADIICRTVFSTSLASQIAKDVFEDFTIFERSVAHVEIRRLIFDPPYHPVPHQPHVLAACARIRRHLQSLVATHMAETGAHFDDIATAILAARDGDTGAAFTPDEILDQLGVMFLAGHETTASALIWAFFILAERPDYAHRLRAEVADVVGDGDVGFEHTKRLAFTRNLFKEALRLYPPITFLPRVAAEATEIAGKRVRRGAMIMIAPWTLHRHTRYWRNPDQFDPDRFAPEREQELTPGAYIPFGQGPRICIGAAFATTEATLILAELIRRFDFTAKDANHVRPAARLTTRPAKQILMTARARH